MVILNKKFDGPHHTGINFNTVAGVYVITTIGRKIVDVGETDNLKERIPSHDRKPCWTRNMANMLYFYHESRSDERLKIEKQIRDTYNPVCGVK